MNEPVHPGAPPSDVKRARLQALPLDGGGLGGGDRADEPTLSACEAAASPPPRPSPIEGEGAGIANASAALFDRRAWRFHRARAAVGEPVDFLHAEIADRLLDRLDVVNRAFAAVLDLGARDAALGRALAARPGTRSVVAAEPAPQFLAGVGGLRIAADPELLPFGDASFDLIASNLLLHWAADLPGVLVQLRRALQPDGLLLAAMLGGNTLVELRTALFEAELAEEGGVSPRVSPTVELADAAALLQRAGFALPVADSETITVTYPDILALLRDLRGMGETNALAARRRFLRRATLARAAALYAERFGDVDGRIPATFEVLFLCGWAPHPSQPKPLRRGSATTRLSDALKPKS
jgi:NADH dehydrogenase [ubiquinone] 1 alpha subcomplex assembly factor 5